MTDLDVIIIGAGIAGASLAHAMLQLAPRLKLAIVEAESQPGYHTTGRSAAFYAGTYGGPLVQPLTLASHDFLQAPPAEFSDSGFLQPRGIIYIARHEDADSARALSQLQTEFQQAGLNCDVLHTIRLLEYLPLLRSAWQGLAIHDADCADIDVAGLHQACLRSARQAGGQLMLNARVEAITHSATGWLLTTAAGDQLSAPRIVNAAGAWADDVAVMAGVPPIGMQALRRTMVVAEVDPPPVADLPIVMDVQGSFYMRPDNGLLWLSPHDEIPDVPRDVQPEELDIAIAVDRFEQVCDWPLRRIRHSWAGLRNFAADRLPVLGMDPAAPGFGWCAGQGGWGIQTAPAAAALAAAVLLEQTPQAGWDHLDPRPYDPARFR